MTLACERGRNLREQFRMTSMQLRGADRERRVQVDLHAMQRIQAREFGKSILHQLRTTEPRADRIERLDPAAELGR